MQRLVLVALIPLLALLAAQGGQAADLQGAGAALKALSERQNPAQPPQGKGPLATFRRDLASFSAAAPSIPPTDAAKGWLALYDRYVGLDLTSQEQPVDPLGPPRLPDVVAALPPPSAWPAIYDALQRRIQKPATVKDHGLLLLGALLNEDQATQSREFAALLPLIKGDKQQTAQILKLQEGAALRSGDPARIFAVEQAKIATLDPEGSSLLTLPDLVTLVGAPRAEQLLRKALLVSNALITIQGSESARLARRLALELVPQLKTAQWSLAQSIDAAPLYEALERRFAPPKNINAPASKPGPKRGIEEPFGTYDPKDEARGLARLYYFLGLVTSGRTLEALRLASGLRRSKSNWEHQSLSALDEAGKPEAVAAFVQAALAKDPALPLWDLLVTASARAHGSEAALKLIQSTLQRKDLPAEVYRSLQRRLYHAYLAADRLDDALAELRKILNDRPAKTAEDSEDPARQMVRLGSALGRNELVEDGLAVMRRDRKDGARRNGYEIADTLVDIGRDVEAEKELIELLRVIAQSSPPGQPLNSGSEYLVRLAGVYYRAGRWEDILALLKSAPNWSAADLSELLFQADATDTYLGQMTATALARTGERESALRIVKALLTGKAGGYDPAYALLVELEGERALPFLAELFARDQFEERPLIWKAQILFKAGKLEEAEAAARAAIAIDPSDGEQKHGHRMKVYSVLADIREARGDQKQADLFRGAVKAIRSAEQADVLYQAGLLDRGIKHYEKSLTYFQDAYCIQSRLAVQLASQGEWEKAEEHYRRAFELMPDSFGRMESHCFGCEGVFGGRRAEGIAERVFKDLLVKTPDKPQVYYLLAYLRNTQGRYPEALEMIRQAVKRDPDYLNAWKLMLTIGRQMRLPSADADAAALGLMRLDPLGRHVQFDISEVTSLKTLWETFARLQALKPPPLPEKLYPLTATAEAQEKSGSNNYSRRVYANRMRFSRYSRYRGYYSSGDEPILTPGEAVAQHGTVEMTTSIVESDLNKQGGPRGARFF